MSPSPIFSMLRNLLLAAALLVVACIGGPKALASIFVGSPGASIQAVVAGATVELVGTLDLGCQGGAGTWEASVLLESFDVAPLAQIAHGTPQCAPSLVQAALIGHTGTGVAYRVELGDLVLTAPVQHAVTDTTQPVDVHIELGDVSTAIESAQARTGEDPLVVTASHAEHAAIVAELSW